MMRKLYNAISLAIVAIFVFSAFTFMGCSSKPNAQQMQALEEQKNAALAAESTLEEKRREKSRLQSELNKKRSELQAAQNELETVKKRLGQ